MLYTDFLERYIDRPGDVYLGYTSYTKKRIMSANVGIWLGWRNGIPFFDMRFRYSLAKEKFSLDVGTHFKSCSTLLETIWPWTDRTNPPLILISSRKAAKFLREAQFKWSGISDREKAKMFFWMDSMAPQIEAYDPLMPPFSLLREKMLIETVNLTKSTVDKKLFDYSEFL